MQLNKIAFVFLVICAFVSFINASNQLSRQRRGMGSIFSGRMGIGHLMRAGHRRTTPVFQLPEEIDINELEDQRELVPSSLGRSGRVGLGSIGSIRRHQNRPTVE